MPKPGEGWFGKVAFANVVEIREGDALETLKSINEPVGVLFLDGWKDLYMPITQMLLPRMEAGSVLVADNINMFPRELKPFREFLLDSERGGFVTTTLSVGNSLEFAVKL